MTARWRWPSAALVALLAVAGCSGRDDERWAKPGSSKPSPSKQFTAVVERGPDQNGVKTWRPVILDADGREVFRDDEVYSTRHGVGVTWLSGQDQLWILSGDVGPSRVDRTAGGPWVRTPITPERVAEVPDEIRNLGALG